MRAIRSRGSLVLWIAAAAVALTATAALGADASQDGASEPGGPIVVQNAYFPKPGLEAEVLATRLEGCAIRARLGLVVGRVFERVSGPDGGPYVVWEAEYESLAARSRDVEEVSESDEFSALVEKMGPLIEHFERSVWRIAEPQTQPQ